MEPVKRANLATESKTIQMTVPVTSLLMICNLTVMVLQALTEPVQQNGKPTEIRN